MSFIAYYFHWGSEEVLALTHGARRRWCREISVINAGLNPSDSREKSIREFGGPRRAGRG